jgi:hypothetical protein
MASTDFMLLLVRALKALVLHGGEFYLSVSRLAKIRDIAKCLVSFLEGPNFRNQLDLAESGLSELVFDVMRVEHCKNRCRL